MRESTKVVLASDRQDWCTPEWFLDLVRLVAPIALDPAGHPFSFVRAWTTIYSDLNGLTTPWFVPDFAQAFINPPYGRDLWKWCHKFQYEWETHRTQQTALIPARVGTKYWHKYVWPGATSICFLEGRMTFVDPLTGLSPTSGATFDASVLYYGSNVSKFEYVFKPYGELVTR